MFKYLTKLYFYSTRLFNEKDFRRSMVVQFEKKWKSGKICITHCSKTAKKTVSNTTNERFFVASTDHYHQINVHSL